MSTMEAMLLFGYREHSICHCTCRRHCTFDCSTCCHKCKPCHSACTSRYFRTQERGSSRHSTPIISTSSFWLSLRVEYEQISFLHLRFIYLLIGKVLRGVLVPHVSYETLWTNRFVAQFIKVWKWFQANNQII